MSVPRRTEKIGTVGLSSRSLGSKVAIFGVAAAMIAGSALIGSGAAFGADAFAVTSPANNSTGVVIGSFKTLNFTGTGLPAGDTASVSYLDSANVAHNATFGGSTRDSNGGWTGTQNFAALSQGQVRVVATVTALDATTLATDTSVTPATVTFTFQDAPNPANPFVVTSPQNDPTNPVASTTPAFTGTGNPGATVTITYGARAGATATAGTVKVASDGNWTATSDFSQLEPGATQTRATLTETGADGNVFPGSTVQRVNLVFPSAPSSAIPLTLVTTPSSSTLTSAKTAGVSFNATGFSPGEGVTLVVTDSNGTAVSLGNSQPNLFANTTDGSVSVVLLLPATAGTGTYTVTLTGVRSVPTRTVSGTFVVVADAATTPTGTLPVVSG